MPVCCRIFLCCDPPLAAKDLADHEEIPLAAALKIGAGYQLVPKSIESGPGPATTHQIESATKRLAKLHRHVKGELTAILIDLGHSAEAGS